MKKLVFSGFLFFGITLSIWSQDVNASLDAYNATMTRKLELNNSKILSSRNAGKYLNDSTWNYSWTGRFYDLDYLSYYTYDPKLLLSSTLGKTDNGSPNFYYNLERLDQFYDAKNNNTITIKYLYDTMILVWKPVSKDSFIYDASSLKKENYSFNQINNAWNMHTQRLWVYDAQNRITSRSQNGRNSDTSAWNPVIRNLHTYNSNPKVDTMITQRWDAATKKWINTSKAETFYDINNNRNKERTYIINATTNAFSLNRETDYTFDSHGNEITTHIQSYTEATMTYANLFRNIKNYDINDNLISLYYYRWNKNIANYENFGRDSFFYSLRFPTNINDLHNINEQVIYPNPCNDYIFFNTLNPPQEIYIMNELGLPIISIRNFNKRELDLSNLGSGIYFYTIKDQSTWRSGKFLKN